MLPHGEKCAGHHELTGDGAGASVTLGVALFVADGVFSGFGVALFVADFDGAGTGSVAEGVTPAGALLTVPGSASAETFDSVSAS